MEKFCGEEVSLRIFLVETDKYQGKVLYEQIVAKAKKAGIAGATVFRGLAGFGSSGQIRTSKILRLSLDLPLVIEIIDTEENIAKLLPFLDEAVQEGLITMGKVKVIKYRHKDSK
jgi:uncharacterized protein